MDTAHKMATAEKEASEKKLRELLDKWGRVEESLAQAHKEKEFLVRELEGVVREKKALEEAANFLAERLLPLLSCDWTEWLVFSGSLDALVKAVREKSLVYLGLQTPLNNRLNPLVLTGINLIDKISRVWKNCTQKVADHYGKQGAPAQSLGNLLGSEISELRETLEAYTDVQVNLSDKTGSGVAGGRSGRASKKPDQISSESGGNGIL